MLKKMRIFVLRSLTLFGTLTLSCQKEQNPNEPAVQHVIVKQNSGDDLVEAMAADQLVKDYILADIAFAKEYSIWYNNLTPSEKQIRDEEATQAANVGSDFPDPSHTSQQTDAYRVTQDSRAQQIREKYPQLGALSSEDYVNVQARVYNIVTQNNQPQQLSDDPCVRALSGCLIWCRGQGGGRKCQDSCWFGYKMCQVNQDN